MPKIRTIILFIIIPFVGFILDFVTKQAVIYGLCMPGKTVELLPFFNLVCVLNTGVSFGLFAGMAGGKFFLLTITTVILIAIYFIMHREKSLPIKYFYSLIIAGAFGNIVDRLLHGGVVDFLDFYIKNHHYPAFNVADSLIFIGVCGIIFWPIFLKKKGKTEA